MSRRREIDEPAQPPGDGHRCDPDAFTDEFEVDLTCRPLMLPTQFLDPLHHHVRGPGGTGVRCTRTITKSGFTECFVSAHPLRNGLAGYPGFCGDMGDWAVLAAFDQAQSSGRGQWGISVGHEG